MATIDILAAAGLLNLVETNLKRGEFADRRFFITPKVQAWLENTLPTLDAILDEGRQSPVEQVFYLFHIYITGVDIAFYGRAHIMTPHDCGIYELKTPDVRFFGWFVQKDCFVAAEVDAAARIKTIGLYGGYRDAVVRFRDNLNLDEPKYISGDIADVIST